MARQLTPKGRQRKADLIAYATHRFAVDGYHPTSVADIVGGLGVGKGVFYWYFDSKEELFLEILRESQTQLRRCQRSAIEGVEDAVERIERAIRAGVLWMAANEDLRRLFEFAKSDATFAGAMKRGQKVLIADAEDQLRTAIAQGRIPDRDPEALAHAIFGITNQLTMAYADDAGKSPSEVADLVVAICRKGFAG